MNKKLIIGVLLLLAGGIFVLYSQGIIFKKAAEVAKEPLKKVRLAYVEQSTLNLFLKVGKDKGIFTKNGIEVEETLTTKNAGALLIAKSVDAIYSSSSINLSAYLNGQDVVWLSQINSFPPAKIGVSRFPKNDMSKVRNIGVISLGGGDYYEVAATAKNLGIDIDKVEYVAAATDEARIALLEKGEVDFIKVDTSKAGAVSKFDIYKPEDMFKNSSFPSGIISSREMIIQKDSELRGLVKAYYEIQAYVRSNKNIVIGMLKDQYKMDASSADNQYASLIASLSVSPVPDEGALENIKSIVSKGQKLKNADRKLSDFIDTRYSKDLK